MKRFKHISVRSLDEAISILNEYKGKARIISGGTDLIGEMKDNILPDYPEVLVNIKSIPGLDFIEDKGQSLVIGALTRLEDIAGNDLVKRKLPMLAEAAGITASPHIREMGTIAGNISQSNRCWYYWVPDNRFNCLRKGGDSCFALTGDGRYHSILGGVRFKETPCSLKCPNNAGIPDYMSKIRDGKIAEAAEILMECNPIPAITGRVCPHFCESECNRNDTDEPVSIRGIERFIGIYVLDNSDLMYRAPENNIPKKVAVIGSGPSGLTAAFFLRRLGYEVTIWEKMGLAGGMLTYGIPPYRLPKEIVKKQVQALVDMGIQFKLNAQVGTEIHIENILSNYDAVYLACGAWKEKSSGIKGDELMISGSQFLREANTGNPNTPGKKVAVIGGGNVAIDVARTLLRLGSEPIIIYRRSKAEMPALKDEVLKAEEEGIEIQFLTLPVEAEKKASKIALKCQRMELGPADESGRPRPITIKGSDFITEYDAVIKAIGEDPDTSIVPGEFIGARGRIKVDESTFHAGKNLFAGGDFVTGPSTVVSAIAAGRKVAGYINRYLSGPELKPDQSRGECVCDGQAQKFNSQFLKPAPRHRITELPVVSRIQNLNLEESGGLDSGAVKEEANRCFNCSCVAVNSSDMAPALIALNAQIITTRRAINAEEFFAAGIEKSTILDEDEIVKEIRVPVPEAGTRSVFTKFALRKSIDFPVVNCAAVIGCDQGIVKFARICLNSVFNEPFRVIKAEQVISGQTVDESLAENAAQAGLAEALPLVNNQYKIYIAKTLVKRAILACTSKS